MTSAMHIDLETRSRVNLLTEGVYNYALDDSTEILCMAWAIDDGPVKSWQPPVEFPDEVREWIESGKMIKAHNADFERLMFEHVIQYDYAVPPPKRTQWFCTSYQARCNNLPGALASCARALRLKHQKDVRGRELIKLLCIPQPDGTFHSTPSLMDEMVEYCKQDVEVEREIDSRLRQPSPDELEDYFSAGRVNDRGIHVDVDFCLAALNYASIEQEDLRANVERLTSGEVTKVRGTNLTHWVFANLEELEHLEEMEVYRNGEKKLTLDKAARERLLAYNDLMPHVREVIESCDLAQKSSVGKFKAMALRADPDDHRIRGAILPNGASASGRFSSRGCQVHNFPRECHPDPDTFRLDIIEDICPEWLAQEYGDSVMNLLSSMLRPSITPADGNVLLVSDWSAIEGRCCPWLADSVLSDSKLQLYREGQDTYKIAAESIYGVSRDDIDSDQRQVGKVAELALQFGGGAGAFRAMAAGYGISVSKDEAEHIKSAWREANHWCVKFWRECEQAAHNAYLYPGDRFFAGKVSYFSVDNVLIPETRTLFCQLPDERLLTYPDVRLEMRTTPWGAEKETLTVLRAAFHPKVNEKEWPRANLYGGLLVENVTQGTAASLLRHAIRDAEAQGLEVIFHVHDELIAECREDSRLDENIAKLEAVMNTPPEWAKELPMTADVEVMKRYGK